MMHGTTNIKFIYRT